MFFMAILNGILLVSLISFTFSHYNKLCSLGMWALIWFWFVYLIMNFIIVLVFVEKGLLI